MTRRQPPTTQDTIDAFVNSRKAGRCSQKYEASLRYLLAPLARDHQLLPARPEPIERTLASLSHLADQTRYNTHTAIRMLYRFSAQRLGTANPTSHINRPPRPKKKVPRYLTEHEVDQLIFANQRRRRDNALIRLLLDTGARLGEIHALTWRDLSNYTGEDGTNQWLLKLPYDGKTGEREVPVSPNTAAALRRLEGNHPWLNAHTHAPLSKSGLQKAVQRALARAGITGGPHLLRHTFGRLYILADGDLFSLQRILGHSDISTTRIYADLDFRDVHRQHQRFSPMARRDTNLAAHQQAHQLELLPPAAQGGPR
jgi:integrase